ncbi:MAG: PhnD/SsuA/transferrin family substrate-binding protein [Bradymonadia bacterium]
MKSLTLIICAVCLALGSALPTPTFAQSPDTSLVLGVYAPRLRFANSLARSNFANQVAQGLSTRLGRPVKGRGFARKSEFVQQVKSGAVQIAVVGAQTHVEHPQWAPIAQGTRKGKPAAPMVLLSARGGSGVAALSGGPLAEIAVGRKDAWFRTQFLLQGLVPSSHFGKGRVARDAQGALSLVKLGKAQGAFVYQHDAQGGSIALTTRPVMYPVLVITGEVDDALRGELKQAARSITLGSEGPLSAFATYNAGLFAALKLALNGSLDRSQKLEPLWLAPGDPPSQIPAWPGALGDLPAKTPAPAAGFATPTPPPELF